jgi:hypothetical protein
MVNLMFGKDINNITRFEVIDDNGRSYVLKNIKNIQLSVQDNDKTLKVFLTKK